MTSAPRTIAQRLSPFVIALGVLMTAVGAVGAISGGGSDEERTATPVPPTTVRATTPVPPTTVRATTPVPPTTPPENPQQFFASLARAFTSNDDTFLFDRLHPLVLTRYGADQCRAYFASQSVPDYAVEVLEVGGAQPWDWTLDGRTDRLPESIPVRIRSTDDGATFREGEAHLVRVGTQLRWFTDCGTPV